MKTIEIRNGESNHQLLARFRRAVARSGVLRDMRKKRWFVSKSEQRRMDKKKAVRRINRRSRRNDA
ncbi:MAG TPA: 30S ribosomal protein S21 [Anaerolineales bacterium]|nr:30S ribosomal protein S21 [Anaerolineales bacterium]